MRFYNAAFPRIPGAALRMEFGEVRSAFCYEKLSVQSTLKLGHHQVERHQDISVSRSRFSVNAHYQITVR
jgi:hypothetical protein